MRSIVSFVASLSFLSLAACSFSSGSEEETATSSADISVATPAKHDHSKLFDRAQKARSAIRRDRDWGPQAAPLQVASKSRQPSLDSFVPGSTWISTFLLLCDRPGAEYGLALRSRLQALRDPVRKQIQLGISLRSCVANS